MSEADAKAYLFNAITRHPASRPLLFSSRQKVADRLWPLMLREIHRQVRINKRQDRKWRRKYARAALGEGTE